MNCQSCYGKGYLKCSHCAGGVIARCEYCGGYGKIACSACNGYVAKSNRGLANFLFLIFYLMGVAALQGAISRTIDASFTRETTRHFLQIWLSLMLTVFVPISFLVFLVSLLAKRFWTGTLVVLPIGVLSFIGTGIYLFFFGSFLR